MPYAKFDENGKLLGWYSHNDYDNLVEFTNEEEVRNLLDFGARTFEVENKIAVWTPADDEERETVENNNAIAKAEADKQIVLEAFASSVTVPEPPAEKIGYITKPIYQQEGNSIVWVFVKDPNYIGKEDGSYLNPFTYYQGEEVEKDFWYTDGDNIWLALKSGCPNDFEDTDFFDIIEVN